MDQSTFDNLSGFISSPEEALACSTFSLRWLRTNLDKNHNDFDLLSDRLTRLEVSNLKLSLSFDFFSPSLFPCLLDPKEAAE